MDKKDCFELGYVIKRHGFKGEISIKFDVKNPDHFRSIDALFVDINNQLIPFFIDRISLNNKGIATIKLEDIDNEEQNEVLLKKKVYLPLAALPEDDLDENDFSFLKGFKVSDSVHGNIGVIVDIIEQTAQQLLQIDFNGKGILIPAVSDIIREVDKKKKQIRITAPEGLIELYI